MVERKLTGAHYGLRDWAMQRATAVYHAGVHRGSFGCFVYVA